MSDVSKLIQPLILNIESLTNIIKEKDKEIVELKQEIEGLKKNKRIWFGKNIEKK